jgi:hypothetical protein
MKTLSVEKLSDSVYLLRYHPNADWEYTGVCTLVRTEENIVPKGFIMPDGMLGLRKQFKSCIEALRTTYKSERKWRAN